MPPRQYKCSACGHRHIKPINDKCPFVDINQHAEDEDIDIPCAQRSSDDQSTTSSEVTSISDVPMKMGEKILEKLVSIEDKVASMQHQINSNTAKIGEVAAARGVTSTVRDDTVIPSMGALQTDHIQQQVDARLRQIGQLGDDDIAGRYKSQRGGGLKLYGLENRLLGPKILLSLQMVREKSHMMR